MANYSSLKTAIRDVVRTNGNNEITGALLQQSLVTMIESLGALYQFAGVAISSTTPGTPDQNVMYIAGAGTFPNFGGTEVKAGEIGIFTYNGTWAYNIIDVAEIFAEKIDGHATVSKQLSAYSGQQQIYLADKIFGPVIGVRIVSNTSVSAGIQMAVYSNGTTSYYTLTNEWLYVEKPAIIDGLYIYASNVSTAGQVSVEILYGDFADLYYYTKQSIAEINSKLTFDDEPTIGSTHPVESNGLFLRFNKSDFDKVTIGRKNLFDPLAATSGKYINSSGNYAESGSFSCSAIIPVEPDTDYHLSAIIPGNNDAPVGNANSYGIFYNQDGTRSVFSTNSTSIHTPNNCYAIEFSFINASSYTNQQLEKGNQRTAYESFVASDLYSMMDNVPVVGSRQPVKSNGIFLELNKMSFPQVTVNRKNLFDLNAGVADYYINSSGNYASSTSFCCSEIIPVEPNTDYYLSNGNNGAVGNVNSYGFYYCLDGTKVLFNTGNKSIHTPNNCYAVEFSYIKVYKPTVQFEKGTQRTAYESFISSDISTFIENAIENLPDLFVDCESILPRQIFVIKGEQNSIYHSEYCKNYNDNNVYADKNSGMWSFFKRCWRIQSTDNPSGNLSFTLRSRRYDSALKLFDIPVRVGDKAATSVNKKINIIGDSFCYGGHYIKQISDCCGNADFVGMRKTQYYPTLYCEGRGGWALSTYFSPISSDVSLTHMQPFSPFMHAAGYKYYGVIEFWAAIVNGTSQYPYGTNGFDNYTSWFGTDGRKINPSTNDLMYNTTAQKYEYWDGSNWVQLNTAPEFVFNYAKYIEVWQIASPDFVVIQLGTNDFFSGVSGWEMWAQRMDAVIASINQYASGIGKTINILLCTVLTASGTPNNTYKDGVIKRNHYYYEARKAVINKYDGLENYTNNHVTVVDTGVVVDDEFGFLTEEQKPFDYYNGSARELFDTNGVHPDIAGYKQFGNPIAGAIQYLR